MTRRVAAGVASLLIALGGLWLVLAPFALGIQPTTGDWTHETTTDVWSGIGIAVLGMVGLVAFGAGLLHSLRERGVIAPAPGRRRSRSRENLDQPPATPTAQPPEPGGSSDLDALLRPLVAALTDDLNRGREVADPTAPRTTANGSARRGSPSSGSTPDHDETRKETR